jgi:hypothetical protein
VKKSKGESYYGGHFATICFSSKNWKVIYIVVKLNKIIRQYKEIAICETSFSGTMYNSSLLLCVLQTTQ